MDPASAPRNPSPQRHGIEEFSTVVDHLDDLLRQLEGRSYDAPERKAIVEAVVALRELVDQ